MVGHAEGHALHSQEGKEAPRRSVIWLLAQGPGCPPTACEVALSNGDVAGRTSGANGSDLVRGRVGGLPQPV